MKPTKMLYEFRIYHNGINDQPYTLHSLAFEANPNADSTVERIKTAFRQAAEKLIEGRAQDGYVCISQDKYSSHGATLAEALDISTRSVEEMMLDRRVPSR